MNFNNIIKRTWKEGRMVNIEDLSGVAFQAESGGHSFWIYGEDENGEPIELSGTPAGVMLRADNQDVALNCSVVDGVVIATLPQNAYSVPGRFGITVYLTGEWSKTAIYAAVGTVTRTSSGTIAPPAGADVVTLVNSIATAVAAIPVGYNASFAPAYSASSVYAVGQYVTYNGTLYRCTTAITSGETWNADHWTAATLGNDVSDLKSAIGKSLDGCFIDIGTDKYWSDHWSGIDYVVTGNVIKFNSTPSANLRFKISGDAFEGSANVKDAWRQEQIGLIVGHEYMLCAEYVSGTGDMHFIIYKDSGTGESIEINKTTATDREVIYGNRFTATSTNARCLCAYAKKNVAYSNLVVRFGILDVTMLQETLWNKGDLKTIAENNMIGLLKNRYAASGMVDFSNVNGSSTYLSMTVTVQGNKYTLNGSVNDNLRVKITNGIAGATSVPDTWYAESLPVLDQSHKYVIAVSKLSGASTVNKKCRVGFYNKDGTSGYTTAQFVSATDGFSTGVVYSDVFKASDVACLILYFPNGADLTNVVLQIDLIDVTAMKDLKKYLDLDSENDLKDYYFEDDYIDDRIADILDTRESLSINSESFLWFTDPHYYYLINNALASTQQNGMQSVQLADYIRRKVNNRPIICGGDLLRGTITKAVCLEYLSKARNYLNPIYDDLFMCLGNHEYNNPAATSGQRPQETNSAELYSLFIKNQEYFLDSVSSKGDFAYTNRVRKVKYFIIGTRAEKDLFTDSVTWLASELLNVESGYHVIIVSHIGLDYSVQNTITSNFQPAADLIDAVNAKGTYTYSGTTYNYANINFEIVCALTGHVHYDGYAYTTGGTPIIATTCDRAFVGSDGDDGIREVRKPGTIGEQALDYVMIDFDARTIDLIRIGGSILGASYDSETGLIYDTDAGTSTEYTGTEWVIYSPYKDRHFTY